MITAGHRGGGSSLGDSFISAIHLGDLSRHTSTSFSGVAQLIRRLGGRDGADAGGAGADVTPPGVAAVVDVAAVGAGALVGAFSSAFGDLFAEPSLLGSALGDLTPGGLVIDLAGALTGPSDPVRPAREGSALVASCCTGRRALR